MTVVRRKDGTQFVTHAYRELLSMKKKTEFVQELRLLTEQQGQYVQIFNKENAYGEVALSMEPGYLLGESIWHYFNEPDNLIYCEALPDSAELLVVAVTKGSIIIDDKIIASSLQSRLLPLMTGDIPYRIFTSGNVPLRRAESFGTFRFPNALIESFEELDGPLLPRLPALKALQLQPLPLTLKNEHLNNRFSATTIALSVLFFVAGAWWLLMPDHQSQSLHQSTISELSSPYSAYTNALSTPAPALELKELGRVVSQVSLLPGWETKKVMFKHSKYRIEVTEDGGSLSFLRHWSNANNYQLQLGAHGSELMFHSQLAARPAPKLVYSLPRVVTKVMDRLNRLLQYQAVSLEVTQERGEVQETKLKVHLESISPGLLDLVGRQLDNMPVELVSAEFDLHSGLMSGNIYLLVWGK